jgi:Na+-driven multidrug efflux pump
VLLKPAKGEKAQFIKESAQLLRLGGPLALSNAVTSIGGLVMQAVVNSYGAAFIAGIAAAWKLYGLMEIIGGGYEAAVATFVAQNKGAENTRRWKSGVSSARNLLLVVSAIVALIIALLGRQLLGTMLVGESAAEAIAVGRNQLYAMAILMPSLYMLLIYRSALQGTGSAFWPMVSGFIELAMRIAGILTLPLIWGYWGVYIAEVIGWPVAAAQLIVAYRRRAK